MNEQTMDEQTMDEYSIAGKRENLDLRNIEPRSLIFNYPKSNATLVYSKYENTSKMFKIKRTFEHIFGRLNRDILALDQNMILPHGCVYHTMLDKNHEAFLMQESPGIRSIRLTNKDNIIRLVSAMYGKFLAETKIMERNVAEGMEVSLGYEDKIKLRKQYIESQSSMIRDNGEKKYKLAFRLYFPYTYILISVQQMKQNTSFGKMYVATSLEPINTLNDYIYPFPLSNVSKGGGVCTGKLPLGDMARLNMKLYVEKMVGYFWNNRFNGDITFGPQTYGEKNFLGNWFEWEYMTYIDPTEILRLKFDQSIANEKMSVMNFIDSCSSSYSPDTKKHRIFIVDADSIVKGFEDTELLGDDKITIENGTATKYMDNVCESINLDGFEIRVGQILETEKKKFRIISFGGLKNYNIDGNQLLEKSITVTSALIRDQKGRIHKISLLTDIGSIFILDGYRKHQNFERFAYFGEDLKFESGELIALFEEEDLEEPEKDIIPSIDMIKTIRNIDSSYIIEFMERGEKLRFKADSIPTRMQKINLMFASNDNEDMDKPIHPIHEGDNFIYRTQKILTNENAPSPRTIFDFLSDPVKAEIRNVKFSYKKDSSTLNYARRNNNHFYISYLIVKEDGSVVNFSKVIDDCYRSHGDNYTHNVVVPFKPYILTAEQEFTEIYPVLEKPEMIVMGNGVYQSCPVLDEDDDPELSPIKIMRDNSGNENISTKTDKYFKSDVNLFRPSAYHLKNCIEKIDDVKTFRIRDLFQTGTDKEYIEFKVGDEVLLASDWNPDSSEPPMIKKIYDFIVLADRYTSQNALEMTLGSSDYLTSGLGIGELDIVSERYHQYRNMIPMTEQLPNGIGCKFKKGILFAVIDDGTENLELYPMIDSECQHFLSGIAHVVKQLGTSNIKAGDYIKAKTTKIPYFPKKVVDKIVGFIDVNKRPLVILHSGLTMWFDIVQRNFKVFAHDELTENKVNFYEEKTRKPNMRDFVVLYGDQWYSMAPMPILAKTSEEAPDDVASIDYRKNLYDSHEDGKQILSLTKTNFEALKQENGFMDVFETFCGLNSLAKIVVRPDGNNNSFLVQYIDRIAIGKETKNNLHIADFSDNPINAYDIMYKIYSQSLHNGVACMDFDTATKGLINRARYSYYSSPFQWDSNIPYTKNSIKCAMVSFPTPRILKKDTRNSGTFSFFRYMGPQNIFYSRSDMSKTGRYAKSSEKQFMFAITSRKCFPEV